MSGNTEIEEHITKHGDGVKVIAYGLMMLKKHGKKLPKEAQNHTLSQLELKMRMVL